MNEEVNKEELLKRVAVLEAQVHDLEKDLIHDKLTGLKTRAFFEEEAGIYLDAISNVTAAKRKDWFGFKNLSFLFIDIDHFKKVNDTYGHDKGDIVLSTVAKTIQKSIREGDTAARWGGEEMVVSLLGANEEDARIKAEDIRKAVEKIKFPEIPDLKVTVSIGVATADGALTCAELIKKADDALYEAKESGRNKVAVYSEMKKGKEEPTAV